MATAQEIVIRAYRLLGATDINEVPSPNEMQVGLDTLNAMIASWATKSLNVEDQAVTATTELGSVTVTGIASEDIVLLARGMNVAGVGIPAGARVKSVDIPGRSIKLTAAATQSGIVQLAFTVLPFEAKHEQGVIALLAMQLAPPLSIDNIPAMVVRNAHNGMAAIRGQFRKDARSRFDLPRDEHLTEQSLSNG